MTFEQAMEPLYRYVDGLDDVGRDRIVTGTHWRPYAHIWKEDGARCLVGHVANVQERDVLVWKTAAAGTCACVEVANALDPMDGTYRVHTHFDLACDFGTERVVAALKARAGATLPPMATEREAPQATEVAR